MERITCEKPDRNRANAYQLYWVDRVNIPNAQHCSIIPVKSTILLGIESNNLIAKALP
jgi:hypothetical protein